MSCHKIELTKAEQKFIARLEKLLANGPKSLSLFGWSGSLKVLKEDADGHSCVVGSGFEMIGDGGDPAHENVCQDAEIEYL